MGARRIDAYKSGRVLAQILLYGLVLILSPVLAEGLSEPGSGSAVSPAQTLQFDLQETRGKDFFFDLDDPLIPDAGTFELESFLSMSNDLGERWAVVTVRNLSTGDRFLKSEHLVATFADGTQSMARNLNVKLTGGQRFSGAVFFGHSPFPLVRVEARLR